MQIKEPIQALRCQLEQRHFAISFAGRSNYSNHNRTKSNEKVINVYMHALPFGMDIYQHRICNPLIGPDPSPNHEHDQQVNIEIPS